jgi:branched-chain amino acid transport system permease protein
MEQVIANGLYLGAQYALIALGLTLIFALMNVLNFAHGQMYVLGGFVTYTIYGKMGVPFVIALLVTGVTLAAVGAVVEKFLFRPVIKRSVREKAMLLAAATFFWTLISPALRGKAARRAEDRQGRLQLRLPDHAL